MGSCSVSRSRFRFFSSRLLASPPLSRLLFASLPRTPQSFASFGASSMQLAAEWLVGESKVSAIRSKRVEISRDTVRARG